MGHLGGLAKALVSGHLPLNTVLFDNCGIDDEELALLLGAFSQMKIFQNFIYKNNVFKEVSLEAMKELLQKRDPENLEELRLVNCQTSSYIVNGLIEFAVTE